MRAGLAGNGDAAGLGGAQQLHTAGGADVLAMHLRAGQSGQQDIARHDQFLAASRPAAQSQRGAPVAFMHHAVCHEGIILAMIHHRQIKHFGVFQGAAHQFIVLDAMTVVGDRDNPGLLEGPDGGQFLPRNVFGDGAGDKDIDLALPFRALANEGDGDRHCQWPGKCWACKRRRQNRRAPPRPCRWRWFPWPIGPVRANGRADQSGRGKRP